MLFMAFMLLNDVISFCEFTEELCGVLEVKGSSYRELIS